jgi:3-oxoacyl-[acyl-carrier protein] reductase
MELNFKRCETMLLHNQIVFITGASRGIGRAIALLMAKHGAQLVVQGRDESALKQTASEIEAVGGNKPLVLCYDVRQLPKIKEAFHIIRKEFGELHVLVNNAGVMEERMLGMVDSSIVQQTMEVNLYSAIYHTQFASRFMMKQKQGSIVYVSSIVGVRGNEGNVVYAASKAGIIGAMKSVAKELAPFQIRVNAVAPGFIKTDLTRHYGDEKEGQIIRNIKMGRLGSPEDVAKAVLFLASDLSSYVTGQVIGVDGGMII